MNNAIQFAIKSLTSKRQTEAEMRERLAKRWPNVNIDQIIARLKELDYLDDEQFCEAWVRYRSLSSPRGRFTLAQELKKKGVQHEFIEQALEEFDEAELMMDLAQKKWCKIKDQNIWKRKEKLQRFLLSRGFNIGAVIEAVNTVAKQDDNC